MSFRVRLMLKSSGKLGGTVGDIESAPFVEAMRQFQFRVGRENFALIHVSLVPDMHGEQKTKPTQTTVHALRGLGLLPDLVRLYLYRYIISRVELMVQIACRLIIPQPLAKATKEKISMFCHVASEQVVGVHDVTSVYHVPLLLQSQGIVEFLKRRLDLASINLSSEMLERGKSLESRWKTITTEYIFCFDTSTPSNSCPTFVCSQERLFDHVYIALVGKYTELKDSYMSVIKALEHSAFRCRRKLILHVCSPSRNEMSPIHIMAQPIVGGIIGFGDGTTRRKSQKVP
jgi:CTP synthase